MYRIVLFNTCKAYNMTSWFIFILLFSLATSFVSHANPIPALIQKTKPSVVAIGIYNPNTAPRLTLVGTGFVVPPGHQVLTNEHVIQKTVNTAQNEQYVVVSGQGENAVIHPIKAMRTERKYDMALLDIAATLPALELQLQPMLAEGAMVIFTGYPISQILGLYPTTHQGMVSSVNPVILPALHTSVLDARAVRQLRDPFMIYQLDATAYPGNSGSPVLSVESGKVIGIINMVLLKAGKESALSDPSGISYAIPIQHISTLREKAPQ
jgi:S1-C subfamily serine protease